jgi:WD40 repeat protein
MKLWNYETGALVRVLHAPEGVRAIYAVRWSPDGNFLTCATLEARICVWQADTGEQVWTVETQSPVYTVEWRLDGCALAIGMAGGDIEVFPWQS